MKRLGQILFLIFLLWIGLWPSQVLGTKCDCRPEINAEAEAQGTCEKTQDDAKWCKLKFNSAIGKDTPEQMEFFNKVEKFLSRKFDNVKSAMVVNEVPPEKWDRSFVTEHFATLFAVALYDTAPERMVEIFKILQTNSEKLLEFVKGEERFQKIEKYNVTGSCGCLEFVDGLFSTMVKTRHSFATKGCRK